MDTTARAAALFHPVTLAIWVALVLLCEVVLIRDLRRKNAHLMPLMKVVWAFTVLYSGPLGVAAYWLAGRGQIAADGIWRRGMRSTAHCYSGCGMGEVVGLFLAFGLFALGNLGTALLTFALAYLFGVALTVGPLVQDGVPLRRAFRDALASETPSIAVMEFVAIGVGLVLASAASPSEPRFWVSTVVSLNCGLIAAWPVNVWLVSHGVKEGMMDPRDGAADGADADRAPDGVAPASS